MAAVDEPGGRDRGSVSAGGGGGAGIGRDRGHSHHSTETKAAFKTTELIAYVVVFIGILIAAAVVSGQDDGPDLFTASQAWLYITILTLGYMISRGLAKSGSREPYSDDH